MTVAELQMLLSDVGKFLRATGASTSAGELEYFSARLQPFAGVKLKAFADSLQPAAPKVSPSSAPKGVGKKGKADPLAVEQACQRVLDVYGKAIDPSVTQEQIEAVVRELQDLDPLKARRPGPTDGLHAEVQGQGRSPQGDPIEDHRSQGVVRAAQCVNETDDATKDLAPAKKPRQKNGGTM